MKKELVAILSDLIALPSPYPPGTSVEICAYAAKRLRKASTRAASGGVRRTTPKPIRTRIAMFRSRSSARPRASIT